MIVRSRSGRFSIVSRTIDSRSESSTSSSVLGPSLGSRSPNAVDSSSPTGRSRLVTTREASRSASTCPSSKLPARRDLLELQARRLGDLVVGRRTAELGGELALGGGHLALALGDVRGQADRPAAVVQRPLDRLADPQGRVGGEAEALAPVELLDRADQPEDALLDEVEQGEIADPLVLAGDRHHEPEVRVDHPLLGLEVTTL